MGRSRCPRSNGDGGFRLVRRRRGLGGRLFARAFRPGGRLLGHGLSGFRGRRAGCPRRFRIDQRGVLSLHLGRDEVVQLRAWWTEPRQWLHYDPGE